MSAFAFGVEGEPLVADFFKKSMQKIRDWLKPSAPQVLYKQGVEGASEFPMTRAMERKIRAANLEGNPVVIRTPIKDLKGREVLIPAPLRSAPHDTQQPYDYRAALEYFKNLKERGQGHGITRRRRPKRRRKSSRRPKRRSRSKPKRRRRRKPRRHSRRSRPRQPPRNKKGNRTRRSN